VAGRRLLERRRGHRQDGLELLQDLGLVLVAALAQRVD
jgi:hypothetical protein